MKAWTTRIGTNLLLLASLTFGVISALLYTQASAQQESGYTFSQTGYRVEGRFWEVWQGGNERGFDDSLYINGLPITALRSEVSPTDGKTYSTQWFERARFEAHPENQRPNDVLLGLLGVAAARGRSDGAFDPVAKPDSDLQWFEQTGHTLGDSSEAGRAIASAWTKLGGLSQFGYPLSQPFNEVSKDDGKNYTVQYFERQRFEYHPENKGTRFEVLLGRLGAEQEGKTMPTPTTITAPTPTLVPASPTTQPTNTPMPTATPDPAVLCEGIPAPDKLTIEPNCGPVGTRFSFAGRGPNGSSIDVVVYIDGVFENDFHSDQPNFRYTYVEDRPGLHHVEVYASNAFGSVIRSGHFKVIP
jgi:hypothetical protein